MSHALLRLCAHTTRPIALHMPSTTIIKSSSVFVNYITTTTAGNGTAAGSWLHYNNNSYTYLLIHTQDRATKRHEWTTGESSEVIEARLPEVSEFRVTFGEESYSIYPEYPINF